MGTYKVWQIDGGYVDDYTDEMYHFDIILKEFSNKEDAINYAKSFEYTEDLYITYEERIQF